MAPPCGRHIRGGAYENDVRGRRVRAARRAVRASRRAPQVAIRPCTCVRIAPRCTRPWHTSCHWGQCDAAWCRGETAATPHNAPFLRAVHNPKGDVMQLVNFVKSFVRDDEGQDLLEYAL